MAFIEYLDSSLDEQVAIDMIDIILSLTRTVLL